MKSKTTDANKLIREINDRIDCNIRGCHNESRAVRRWKHGFAVEFNYVHVAGCPKGS